MYEERYVVFADILGFAEIVRQTGHDPRDQRYNELARVPTEIRSYDEAPINESDDFQFQSFSDSVVMSTASTISGLIYLLYSVSDLSLRLLSNGLLMRGAVAKGTLHHDKLVIFGPAFLTAYNIETNIAKYPRVVLSPEFYEDYRRLRPGLKIPDVLLADDGPPYLNVFAGFRLLNEGYATPEYLNSDEVLFAQKCQRAIQNALNNSIHEPRHYEKLRWLALYWNAVVGTGAAGESALDMVIFPANRRP